MSTANPEHDKCALMAPWARFWRGGVLFLILAFWMAAEAQALTFSFDTTPLPQNVYAFPQQNAAGSAVRTTQAPVVSAPYALKFSGTDNAPTYPSYAYLKLFDVDIPVTSTTVLSYQLYPVTANATSVAVDLQFGEGPDLRDRNLFDDAGVRIHPAYQAARLQVGQYNTVRVVLAPLQGLRIKRILIGYDRAPGTGAFDARLDDLKIEDSKYVLIEGDKVNENDQPFTDPLAIVDPYGVGSSCGSSLATQSTASRACHGGVPHYLAQARVYTGGYARMLARVPKTRDVVVSVCSGSETGAVNFACREHPPSSYCRPKQSSSSAKAEIFIPPTAPAYIDVRWKYIPESMASAYPACDRKAPYAARVLSAQLNVDPRLGDADASGAVTVSDGVIALRCAAGIPGTKCDLLRADLDCDGAIGTTDAVNILRLAAELPIRTGCDRDEDGLLDEWELFGYRIGNDFVDLPGMGANVFRKDIFIECDYMQDATHSHRPSDAAIADLRQAFAIAPVPNEGAAEGVIVHVDTGQMGGGNAVAHSSLPMRLALDEADAGNDPGRRLYVQIRDAHFAGVRAPIFHYCLSVHDVAGALGLGYVPGSQFLVETGLTAHVGNSSGLVMHELGHNLSLGHGGQDGIQGKPNYISVMNGLGGIRKNGQIVRDFSRILVEDLNEAALDEAVGLQGVGSGAEAALAAYGTGWCTPDGSCHTVSNAAGPIDWNRNGITESGYGLDVNLSGTQEVLAGRWIDWDNLRFKSGAIGVVGTSAAVGDASRSSQGEEVSCP